jgi:arylformamidase
MSGAGDPVFDYLTGQTNASQPPLIAAFEREGAEAVAALAPELDIAYGSHPRQRYDLFASPSARATLLYFHAGYWQGRDKAQFRFLAPTFVAAGLSVALVNYPLCPEASLARLTEAVRAAPLAIADSAGGPLVLCGHSAGGHLAVELALTDWAARGEGEPAIAAVVGLSGVYDLAPLLATPLNDKLQLTPESATNASPLRRVAPGRPPALFAVGGLETQAFRDQTEAMAKAWAAAGNAQEIAIVPGVDHFGLLRVFADSRGALFKAVIELAAGQLEEQSLARMRPGARNRGAGSA